jgi:hypothetical protein
MRNVAFILGDESSGKAMFLVTLAACSGAVCFLVNLIFPWIKYDLKLWWKFVTFMPKVGRLTRKKIFFIDLFENQAKKQPEQAFIVFNGRHYTFGEVERRSNQLGNALCSLGVRQGDVVAILEHNGIDFVVMYLGENLILLAISC